MRLKTTISGHPRYKRAMIYSSPHSGTYLFLYDTLEDTSCCTDLWFESLDEAKVEAADQFGISANAWAQIADPLPGAQHDWEQPTQVLQAADGLTVYIAIDALAPGGSSVPVPIEPIPLNQIAPETIDSVIALVQAGQPLSAIKEFRRRQNVGLYEAKEAIGRILAQANLEPLPPEER